MILKEWLMKTFMDLLRKRLEKVILENKMVLGIVGSRTFKDYEKLKDFILKNIDINSVGRIVSGGAKGADTLAIDFAKEYYIRWKIHEALWDDFGRKAGYIRNGLIVRDSDLIIAFWDGLSNGTFDTISQAHNLKKKVLVYSI